MATRTLGSGPAAMVTSSQGFGCMGITAFYGTPMTDNAAVELMGVTGTQRSTRGAGRGDPLQRDPSRQGCRGHRRPRPAPDRHQVHAEAPRGRDDGGDDCGRGQSLVCAAGRGVCLLRTPSGKSMTGHPIAQSLSYPFLYPVLSCHHYSTDYILRSSAAAVLRHLTLLRFLTVGICDFFSNRGTTNHSVGRFPNSMACRTTVNNRRPRAP